MYRQSPFPFGVEEVHKISEEEKKKTSCNFATTTRENFYEVRWDASFTCCTCTFEPIDYLLKADTRVTPWVLHTSKLRRGS